MLSASALTANGPGAPIKIAELRRTAERRLRPPRDAVSFIDVISLSFTATLIISLIKKTEIGPKVPRAKTFGP